MSKKTIMRKLKTARREERESYARRRLEESPFNKIKNKELDNKAA